MATRREANAVYTAGLGTALDLVFVATFVGLGIWCGLPP
jgi:hypothetical protein